MDERPSDSTAEVPAGGCGVDVQMTPVAASVASLGSVGTTEQHIRMELSQIDAGQLHTTVSG